VRKSIRDAYAYVSALLGARIASVHLMLRVSLQAQAYQREAQMKRCNANVSLQKPAETLAKSTRDRVGNGGYNGANSH